MENEADNSFVKEYSWMVRPCSLYDEEYKDCTSIKGRFHQYFVTGSYSDCTQWRRDFENCALWTEKNNVKALKEIVQSEKARKFERLSSHLENDVWEKRTEPPSDWDAPLPEWIQKRDAGSYLAIKAAEEKQADGKKSETRTLCVVS